MDDKILNQIKKNIFEASTLQELQIYTAQLQKRIDSLRPQTLDTNNVFIKILEAIFYSNNKWSGSLMDWGGSLMDTKCF